MHNTALIPARKGSKGIPNKNIIEIFDKPLVAWTIIKALNSKCFNSVIVSTDCEKIAQIAKRYGAKVPFIRSSVLASDSATRNEVISDFFERFKACNFLTYLQPTSPFRSVKSIKKFKNFVKNDLFSPVISVSPITSNSSTILVKNQNGNWKNFDNSLVMNRQESKSKVYKMDGSFFYISRDYWLKKSKLEFDFFRTEDTRYFINTEDGHIGSLDIDDRADLEFAKKLYMN